MHQVERKSCATTPYPTTPTVFAIPSCGICRKPQQGVQCNRIVQSAHQSKKKGQIELKPFRGRGTAQDRQKHEANFQVHRHCRESAHRVRYLPACSLEHGGIARCRIEYLLGRLPSGAAGRLSVSYTSTTHYKLSRSNQRAVAVGQGQSATSEVKKHVATSRFRNKTSWLYRFVQGSRRNGRGGR